MLIPSVDGYKIAQQRRPFTWRRITKRAKDSKSIEAEINDEWQHNGRTIRLGPGTEKNRERPHLPGPHSFSYYRSKQRNPVLKVIETIDNKQLIN